MFRTDVLSIIRSLNAVFTANAICHTSYADYGLGMWRVWVRRGGCIGSWLGNRRERDHWGDLGVDGWIILGWISRKWDVGMWTGLGWPRIGSGGGRL